MVIMMLGVPGAGKSFFARQFAEMFNAPIVSFDKVRYELFAEPNFNKDEETIVERIASMQIEELLKTNKTFIVDGDMSTRISRSTLERLARKNGYNTLVIWVQTDVQTAKIRSLKRSPQRPYDIYNQPLTLEIFERLVKKINPPLPREPHVVISGKHTFPTQAKMVLKKLVSPREEQPADTTVLPPRQTPPLAEPPTRRSVTIQ